MLPSATAVVIKCPSLTNFIVEEAGARYLGWFPEFIAMNWSDEDSDCNSYME